jgi:hypothetical protein
MFKTRLVGLAVLLCVGVACSGGESSSLAPNATEPETGVAAGVPTAEGPAASTEGRTAEPAAGNGAVAEGGAKPGFFERLLGPNYKDVEVPSGTALNLSLLTPVSSDGSKPEDPVRARLTQSIVIDGTTVVPEGTEVAGSVIEANDSGRVKGRASLAFTFDRLMVRDETVDIRTERIAREAAATTREDAKKIGIGAAAGGVIGAIAGGKKGAAIGAAAGGGAGTGLVLATKGEEVRLGAGAAIRATLASPVTIRVPTGS